MKLLRSSVLLVWSVWGLACLNESFIREKQNNYKTHQHTYIHNHHFWPWVKSLISEPASLINQLASKDFAPQYNWKHVISFFYQMTIRFEVTSPSSGACPLMGKISVRHQQLSRAACPVIPARVRRQARGFTSSTRPQERILVNSNVRETQSSSPKYQSTVPTILYPFLQTTHWNIPRIRLLHWKALPAKSNTAINTNARFANVTVGP